MFFRTKDGSSFEAVGDCPDRMCLTDNRLVAEWHRAHGRQSHREILDTNRLVFGTLGTNDRAERILNNIERSIRYQRSTRTWHRTLNTLDRTPGLRVWLILS